VFNQLENQLPAAINDATCEKQHEIFTFKPAWQMNPDHFLLKADGLESN